MADLSFINDAIAEDTGQDTETWDNVEEPSNPFDLLPKAWYTAQLEDMEVVDANSGGKYVKFQWKVIGPKHANKKVFANINIVAPPGYDGKKNDDGVPVYIAIGRSQYRALCQSLGFETKPEDTNQLIGNVCDIHVKIDIPDDPQYNPSNAIDRYEPKGARADASSVPDELIDPDSIARKEYDEVGGSSDSFSDDDLPF